MARSALQLLAFGFAVALLASAAQAETVAYVTHPVWTSRPSASDLRRLYPPGGKGITGQVAADCLIDESGRFTSCEIVSEEPAGLGFGTSTIELSKLFKMKLLDADGVAVPGRKLRLPVRWSPPR
jgi:protein TonB